MREGTLLSDGDFMLEGALYYVASCERVLYMCGFMLCGLQLDGGSLC